MEAQFTVEHLPYLNKMPKGPKQELYEMVEDLRKEETRGQEVSKILRMITEQTELTDFEFVPENEDRYSTIDYRLNDYHVQIVFGKDYILFKTDSRNSFKTRYEDKQLFIDRVNAALNCIRLGAYPN